MFMCVYFNKKMTHSYEYVKNFTLRLREDERHDKIFADSIYEFTFNRDVRF